MLVTLISWQSCINMFLQLDMLKVKTLCFAVRPANHHINQLLNSLPWLITNCFRHTRRVLGVCRTRTIPASGPASVSSGTTTSHTRKPSTSPGLSKHSNPNQKPKAADHHLCRALPCSKYPLLNAASTNASKRWRVMGVRGLDGAIAFHPLIACHVPANKDPDILFRRWTASTPKTTCCKLPPCSKHLCTTFSRKRSQTSAEEPDEGIPPKCFPSCTNQSQASYKLLLYGRDSPAYFSLTILPPFQTRG